MGAPTIVDLAPRDVVARSYWKCYGGRAGPLKDYVYIDIATWARSAR